MQILKDKASTGLEVKLVYDDIRCMSTLPGSYYKDLKKYNIDAVSFSKLKGTVDGEFNNRKFKVNIFKKLIRSLLKLISPLL